MAHESNYSNITNSQLISTANTILPMIIKSMSNTTAPKPLILLLRNMVTMSQHTMPPIEKVGLNFNELLLYQP